MTIVFSNRIDDDPKTADFTGTTLDHLDERHRIEARHGIEAAVHWRSPAADMWVGSLSGNYVGMIEQKDGRYFASGSTGAYVGEYPELGLAQRRLVDDLR